MVEVVIPSSTLYRFSSFGTLSVADTVVAVGVSVMNPTAVCAVDSVASFVDLSVDLVVDSLHFVIDPSVDSGTCCAVSVEDTDSFVVDSVVDPCVDSVIFIIYSAVVSVINFADSVADSVGFIVDSLYGCCFISVTYVLNLYVVTFADSVDTVVDSVPSGAILLDSVIGSVLVSAID
jgi:hypothetical protein